MIWLSLFFVCHNKSLFGISQWCWPDGQAAGEQSNILISVFALVKNEIEKQIGKNLSGMIGGLYGN